MPWSTAVEAGQRTRRRYQMLSAWLEARGGIGAAEEKDGIEAVRAFLSAHGLSRFLAPWEPSEFEPKIPNLAGYRKRADDCESWDYFITSEAWAEVAAGFNKTALADTLVKRGFLIPGSSRRTKVLKFPGIGDRRIYHIDYSILGDDADG
jgi:putative DNA primase/helicase